VSSLTDRISERARNRKIATDEAWNVKDGAVADAPALAEDVDEVEKRIGYAMPPLLRDLYLRVGGGGYGPGNGLFSVTPKARESLVQVYEEKRKANNKWPERLLPICSWGAGIESSIDCSDPAFSVIRHDPNMPKSDVAVRVPAERHYDRSMHVVEACWLESASLEQWLTDWVDGKQLFYLAYAGSDEEDDLEDEDDDEPGEA
jgi:hypothetical protein